MRIKELKTHKRLLQILRSLGYREETLLIVVSALIGVAAGLSAILFDRMIFWSTDFFFNRLAHQLDFLGNNVYLLPMIPAAGALVVGLFLTYLIPQAKGAGVPAVIHSLNRKGGIIPFRVAIGKAFGAAVTIGSGGSAGTEAPIVHIGSTIGSVAGQWLRLPTQHMPVLVASGAAAGIGAIFNAPIAGVLFALEIFLKDINYKTFTPVVIAGVTASTIARTVSHGDVAMFAVPSGLTHFDYQWYELGNFAVLGLLCGVVAVGFIRAFNRTETFFAALRIPVFLKPAVGAFLLGILGLVMISTIQQPGHPPAFFGNGYDWIRHMLNPENYGSMVDGYRITAGFLLALVVLKLTATCLTLGSGGSGGEFGPALFLGAALGGALMMILDRMGLSFISSPASYAIVGMAGLIAGMSHAPLMAILLLFEITGNYSLILPIMIAAVLATSCAQLIDKNSIYSVHLQQMGVRMNSLADLTILRKMYIRQIPLKKIPVIHPQEPLEELLIKAQDHDLLDFVVTNDAGEYMGMVCSEDIRTALLSREAIPLLIVGELVKPFPTLHEYETLETALDLFSKYRIESLPVVDRKNQDRIQGLVTRSDLIQAYQKALDSTKQ